MTRDEIVRMARESELLTTVELIVAEQQQILFTAYKQVWMPDNLEAFAALVAASEREACAKQAENMDAAVLALLNNTRQPIAIAAAIRARGKE